MKITLKQINMVLRIGIVLSGLYMLVMHFITPETFEKFWSYIVTMVFLPWVAVILRKLGIKVSQGLETEYLVFLIPAMILGINLRWYQDFPGYDKVVHLSSGALAAAVCYELLNNCYDGAVTNGKRVKDKRFMFLMIISFVALTAAGWECFEFSYDQLFDGKMQQLLEPGVADTMYDIIAALGGGLIADAIIMFLPEKSGAKK